MPEPLLFCALFVESDYGEIGGRCWFFFIRLVGPSPSVFAEKGDPLPCSVSDRGRVLCATYRMNTLASFDRMSLRSGTPRAAASACSCVNSPLDARSAIGLLSP